KTEIKEIVDLMVSRVRAQVAEHDLQLDLSEEAKDLLVDKGWDPAMGARPLRRAIQRYVEDPLADEVLKAGEMTPGSTVQVDRDAKGDDEDKPLKLKIVKPRKKPAPKKKEQEPEKVGVGAGKGDGDEPSEGDDSPEASGDGDKP
ncbi:MAG: NDP-hexose 4-ketoreductase, partial [Solirubrobacterales bacterium]